MLTLYQCISIKPEKVVQPFTELKITVRHGQFHFRELVNIFSPFLDYLIGHPLTLQTAATVV